MSEETPVSASEYGKSLRGLGFNLIVKNLARSIIFATEVLEARLLFATPGFAAMKLSGHDFMLHSDETYRNNELKGILAAAPSRGIGVELRIYGCDPDLAEVRARQHGFMVLAGSIDKPHGLREAMILDDEGYLWIPSVHLNT